MYSKSYLLPLDVSATACLHEPVLYLYRLIYNYNILVGFGRACAPVRCAHPSFWAHCHAHRRFAAPPKIKSGLFPETNIFPLWPELGPPGRIFFHWAKLHPTELHCILLSYAAPFWAPLHPPELRCILFSYPAPYWAKLHLTELHCILLSYAAPFWAPLHPPELRCTHWATLHPTKLCWIQLSYAAPNLS
jgi:hypothetical protein